MSSGLRIEGDPLKQTPEHMINVSARDAYEHMVELHKCISDFSSYQLESIGGSISDKCYKISTDVSDSLESTYGQLMKEEMDHNSLMSSLSEHVSSLMGDVKSYMTYGISHAIISSSSKLESYISGNFCDGRNKLGDGVKITGLNDFNSYVERFTDSASQRGLDVSEEISLVLEDIGIMWKNYDVLLVKHRNLASVLEPMQDICHIKTAHEDELKIISEHLPLKDSQNLDLAENLLNHFCVSTESITKYVDLYLSNSEQVQ